MSKRASYILIAIVSILFGLSFIALAIRFSLKLTIPFMVVAAAVFFVVVILIFKWLRKHPHTAELTRLDFKWKALLFAIFFVAYIALLLFWFPGTSDNDATDIFKMLSGQDPYCNTFRYHGLNSHHSLGYCLYYFVFYELVNRVANNATLAIGTACFVQIIVVGLCFARATSQIYQATGKKWLLILTVLFLVLNPLVYEMSVTHWKDVMFGSVLFCTVSDLFIYTMHKKEFISKKSNLIILAICLIALTLLRNNGIFISLGVLIYLFISNRKLRKYSIISFSTIIIVSVALIGIKAICNVESSHFSESVGIPLQQIGKTATDTDCSDPEFTEFFNNIIDSKSLKNSYFYATPDKVKFSENFNDEYLDSHKVEFLANYITLGLKHPVSYIKAWVLQTCCVWSCACSSMFPFVPGHDLLHTNPSSGQVALAKFFAIFLKGFNPIYNPGVLFWIFIICILKMLCFKERRFLTILPIAILLFTLLLAIPAYDFRYFYGIHLCLPIMFSLIWFSGGRKISASSNDNLQR